MNEGLIVSTASTRRQSSLPSLPRFPLLLHPHRPVLFFAHGIQARVFNYESQKWELSQEGKDASQHRQKQSLDSNPLIECANGSPLEGALGPVFHSQNLVAADCLCIHCGARSSQTPFRARRPCKGGAFAGGECLWVTAGDDKALCLIKDKSFQVLQRRQQRKKIAVVSFGSLRAQSESQSDCPLYVGDRFGEVFCLPLSKFEGTQKFAGDLNSRRMQTIESIAGVHSSLPPSTDACASKDVTARTTDDSRCAAPFDEEESSDYDEVDMPVLAHSATLTCIQIYSSSGGRGPNWLLTGDRDEKIRACRVETPWKLESALVGHEQFVTDAKILHLDSSLRRDTGEDSLVVSAGGDCCLKIWRLLTGEEILQVPLRLEALFSSLSLVERVNAHLVKNDCVSLRSLDSSLAVFQGALLPLQVFHDPIQELLAVQTLQLCGILLLRVDFKVPRPELISASIVPLSCKIGALLVSRHPRSEVESLGIFAPMNNQMVRLGMQRESVLVGWVVDTEGILQPPVCLEMEVLEALKEASLPVPFVALLQGQSIPQGPASRSDQTQHECFYWKTTRDPDAPSAEERRAKRLRNKHLQQQQQAKKQQALPA